jgi:hypothetical protein
MSKLFSKLVAKCKVSKRPLSKKIFLLFFFTLASLYFLCFNSGQDNVASGGGGGDSEGGGSEGGGFPNPGDYFPTEGKGHYLPGCVIIGVRKCGTRALIDMLNLHPQVQFNIHQEII